RSRSSADRAGAFLPRWIRLPRDSRHRRAEVEHPVAMPGAGAETVAGVAGRKALRSNQGMRTLRLLRRRRAFLNCAAISHDHFADRSMRTAVSREDGSDEFVNQQNFDRAVAELVRLVPIPPESAEWFLDKEAVRRPKWTWTRIVVNPAVLAISIALVVIAGVFTFQVLGRLNDFPGSATARKLLTVAGSTRSVTLDPVNAEGGTLSVFFLLNTGLNTTTFQTSSLIFAQSAVAFLTTTSRRGSPKSGWLKNACNFFFSRQRETARPEPYWRFRVGVMFVRKVGSAQSRNTTAFASWLCYKAVRKTWSRIFLGQSSNSSLVSRRYSYTCSRSNIVD